MPTHLLLTGQLIPMIYERMKTTDRGKKNSQEFLFGIFFLNKKKPIKMSHVFRLLLLRHNN